MSKQQERPWDDPFWQPRSRAKEGSLSRLIHVLPRGLISFPEYKHQGCGMTLLSSCLGGSARTLLSRMRPQDLKDKQGSPSKS